MSSNCDISAPSESSVFQSLFDAALREYETRVGINLVGHPLSVKLETCNSVDSVAALLEEQASAFREFRGDDSKVMKWLKRAVHVLHALSTSGVFGEGIGLPFPPAKAIFAGIGILLAAVKDVTASYDALIDLFESIENFLKRLDIYIKIPSTTAMTEIVVKIMLEILSALAVATKQIKQGRLKKFGKKVLGENDVESVLQRLDRLTQDEARATAAQTLEVVYGLVKNIKVVMDDGKASTNDVREALAIMQQIAGDMDKSKRDKLQKGVRKWLSPPDPWKNHSIACEAHHDGTATWFVESNIFAEWKSSGSLLWIYGKPGSGKSVLCSTIIRDIEDIRKVGLASMAFFYCDFRDEERQTRRGLLSSLLLQFCAHSDTYCKILSKLYSGHYDGSQYPSDNALAQCLLEMFNSPGQAPIYIIVDALDECPKTSGTPSSREKVLTFLEELVDRNYPNLHICVTSRPEPDIETILAPLTSHSICLHDQVGQKQDIIDYVCSVVNSDPKMQRWRAEDKKLVIDTLTRRAGGMFRWVFCQLDILRRCLPARIRRALDELPGTLDDTYDQILQNIDETNWEYAHRLLQCVTVASRPLRVEELAEFLAFDFNEVPIPKFLEDWRPEDPGDAVLSTCSSLLTVINVDGSPVVQFSHFSVKEYLTSTRLAMAGDTISRYHVLMEHAHTIVAQACLAFLLQLDTNANKSSTEHIPLAEYAARYWVDHAQFRSVSHRIQDAMERLFDPTQSHFAIWVWIYDIDGMWPLHESSEIPSQHQTAPLHYAVFCGFRDVAEFLVIGRSQDVNARHGFLDHTPLHVASGKGHHGCTLLLLEYGADANARDDDNGTPLCMASEGRHPEVVRVLLEHGADANACGNDKRTPLHLASEEGCLEVVQILLEHGADVNARDNGEQTPLHLASKKGHLKVAAVLLTSGGDANAGDGTNRTSLHQAARRGHWEVARTLLDYGVDANVRDNHNRTALHWASSYGSLKFVHTLLAYHVDADALDDRKRTPLHCASSYGHLQVVQVLLKHGVDANARNMNDWTALHLASVEGHLEIAQMLLEHGADVNSRNSDNCTALHLASGEGRLGFAQLLLEHGADANTQDNYNRTPLHWASPCGHLESVRVLEYNADANVRDNNKRTPLHLASENGHLEVAQILLEQGADANARDSDNWTPLHHASRDGRLEVARILLEHDADANSRDGNNCTPLHWASQNGCWDIARILLQLGADVDARDSDNWTPLHRASQDGRLGIVHILLEHGADTNARDGNNWTPLHWTSQNGCRDVARVLLECGADTNAQDSDNRTPLHKASQDGHLELAHILLEQGADPDARYGDNWTPLHWASQNGYRDIARILLEHGADANARDGNNWTPLHRASQKGCLEVACVLLGHGADANARDCNNWTPLHRASQKRCGEVARILLKHCADANARDCNDRTPLHRASQKGYLEVACILLEHGADVNARESRNQTPLHLASRKGYPELVRLLLKFRANIHAQNKENRTPFQEATAGRCDDVMQLLLENGAGMGCSN